MPADYAALPRAFALSRLGYYADFVLVPCAAAALIADYWSGAGGALRFAFLVVAGGLAWALAEYLIHRFVFHGPLSAMHDVHHRRPAAYVGVASWGTFATFSATWLAIVFLAGTAAADAVAAGILLAYVFYIAIHDRMHHVERARFGRYVAYMFALHGGHHRGGHTNFGVSSPLFDLIFGTYRSPR